MKAVYVKEFGGAENLEISEVENPPKPKGNEVLVAVKASALNRADILQRKGLYPAPSGYPQNILGLEFAGEVAEIGKSVIGFQIGERVFGITSGGSQAEFLLSDASLLVKIPDNLSFTEAAAIPEAFITAHDAIFTQGNLKGNNILDSVIEKDVESIFKPYQLVSLLDIMRKFYGHHFYETSVLMARNLQSLEGRDLPLDEETKFAFNKVLTSLLAQREGLGLNVSSVLLKSLIKRLSNGQISNLSELAKKLTEIENCTVAELTQIIFLQITPEQSQYYNAKLLFGEEVSMKFPSSSFDIEEAGKCFALSRYTASVFHLMRAIETPLRILGEEVGVVDIPNWNKLLQEIEKIFKGIQDQRIPKPADWKNHRERFYSQASALLRNVKNAWRNETMHLENKYTEEEALRIFNAVKGFMEFLAENLKEEISE